MAENNNIATLQSDIKFIHTLREMRRLKMQLSCVRCEDKVLSEKYHSIKPEIN